MLFRPLELSDRAWIEKCRNADVQPFSALTFPSLLTWAETYGMTIGGDEDFYVIRSQHDKAYYMPCGREDKCAAFMEETARTERPARFVYATETQAEALEKRGWKHLYRADLSEYILSTPALALSPGFPVTHSFRYKCRHFSKISPYTVREISFEEAVADGMVVTSRGAGTAVPFALKLIEVIFGQEEADRIAGSIIWRQNTVS